MDWSAFTLTDGKRTLASPCVEIVAFSYEPPTADVGRGLEHCLRVFARRYGKQLKFYATGDMKGHRAVDARTLEAPYQWFSNEKMLSSKMLSFFAHSGESKTSFRSPSVDLTLWGFDDPPLFAVRMTLPVDTAGDPDDLVSFVQESLAEFPLENGYAGYSWLYEPRTDDDAVTAWAGPLLLRHPGLNYGNYVPLSNAANKGVVAVNWLTLLGPRLAADLGGVSALAGAVPDDVAVSPVGHAGVLLRAGHEPRLGDVNRHDFLPPYQAVGRLVSPVRASDEALGSFVIRGIPSEAAVDWLRRFFG